ncbi:MAG TPA: UDP-N-acetylglucosamine--N-acetylmuramyl-(pentapeptide) pyrophosphoryl-undecaprenol N-acetylglucosamine transferase, partial [Thermoanaerobaculia bacterium]|nr:UDP-N-acetylglucosamine--N-acetylmuramyl-(pentapeptide) pyrophosphoryl-undecaprenol N-acetylglucosamine transferase [Thermoanaerobaculia bacterium]
PARGIPFHPLPARPLLGRGLFGKAQALTTLAGSAQAASALIRRLGVDAVLGTGGYVSAPAVLGARFAGRPILLLEPNARAGVANRWLSRWATGAAVGYRDTIGDLRCPCWVTGVPVRAAFFAVPPLSSSLTAPRLLVLGGSQGARQINQTVPAAVARLVQRLPELSVLHQAGEKNLEETRQAYADAGVGPGHVEVVPFLDDVAGAMAASHLLVSRAGAITVAEICAAGRPSVLLPLVIAKAHQVDNARLLAEEGAAEMRTPDQVTSEGLADLLAELLADGERLARMGRAARSLARPGAAAAVASRLEELGGEG